MCGGSPTPSRRLIGGSRFRGNDTVGAAGEDVEPRHLRMGPGFKPG